MHINAAAMTTRRRTNAVGRLAACLATLALLATACGSKTPTAASGTTTTTSAAVTTTTVAGPTDKELATSALLAVTDLQAEGWAAGPAELVFPNSATIARTVPACANFAELVFNGGTKHGQGLSGVFSRAADLLFTYVVVFPTETEAAAMVKAASDPAFDACWQGFNEIAVTTMPIGVSSGSYAPQTPPALTLTADSLDVEFLSGSIVLGGSTLEDTCVCVFAQVGRGVVEVHSAAPAMDPATRSKTVQIAIDKLAKILETS